MAEAFTTVRHLRLISALAAQHRRAAGLCQADFCLWIFFFLAWTKFLSVADSEMSVVSVSLTAPTWRDNNSPLTEPAGEVLLVEMDPQSQPYSLKYLETAW